MSGASRDNAGSGSATSSLLSDDSVQQKVAADRLPHVVCLKCDLNEVTGFIGKGPDRSEQPNRISKIHLLLQLLLKILTSFFLKC